MIALDSNVIIDLFLEKKNAAAYFQEVKQQGGIISAGILAEVHFILERELPGEATKAVELLLEFPSLDVANVTPDIARHAGALRCKYYHRSKNPMSYLDAITLATAIKYNADKIITNDADFKNIEEVPIECY